jgi:hypothetical protein
MKTRPRSAVLLHHGLMMENEPAATTERSISSVGTFDCSASSDDEVQSLIGGTQDSPLPLEFRTSPPEGAHRPTRSLSPPPKFFLADRREDMAAPLSAAAAAMLSSQEQQPTALSVANGNNIGSPRKRHRHAHRSHHHIQRPCLDFEKMQQVSSFSSSFKNKKTMLLHHIWVVLFFVIDVSHVELNFTQKRESSLKSAMGFCISDLV